MTGSAQSWAELLWAVIGLALVIYALSGGADLGVGLWSLLAGGQRREAQRSAIVRAIGPIWEANHVWLIFVIVVLFSGFSRAFAVLSTALHIPIALVLLGLVLRGSAYVFHAYGIQGEAATRRWQALFGWASIVTSLALGLVVGGISSGEIRVRGNDVTSGFWSGWLTPFSFSVGFFTLALFALLAAVYLSAETDGLVADDFRRRALAMEGICALLAALVFVLAADGAPGLYERLASSTWTWPVQLATAAAAGSAILLLLRKRMRLARYAVALQVALVLLGWGLSLRGYFIPPDVTLARATTHPEILPTLALVLALGSVVLGPALAYLFWIFKRHTFENTRGS